eukprot:gene26147-11870_t
MNIDTSWFNEYSDEGYDVATMTRSQQLTGTGSLVLRNVETLPQFQHGRYAANMNKLDAAILQVNLQLQLPGTGLPSHKASRTPCGNVMLPTCDAQVHSQSKSVRPTEFERDCRSPCQALVATFNMLGGRLNQGSSELMTSMTSSISPLSSCHFYESSAPSSNSSVASSMDDLLAVLNPGWNEGESKAHLASDGWTAMRVRNTDEEADLDEAESTNAGSPPRFKGRRAEYLNDVRAPACSIMISSTPKSYPDGCLTPSQLQERHMGASRPPPWAFDVKPIQQSRFPVSEERPSQKVMRAYQNMPKLALSEAAKNDMLRDSSLKSELFAAVRPYAMQSSGVKQQSMEATSQLSDLNTLTSGDFMVNASLLLNKQGGPEYHSSSYGNFAANAFLPLNKQPPPAVQLLQLWRLRGHSLTAPRDAGGAQPHLTAATGSV